MLPIINKKETGVNLRRIMDKRGITVKQIKQYLGLESVQSVYHWLNGISMPTIDNLYALSELLMVPIDEIVRGNRAPIIPDISFAMYGSRCKRLHMYYIKLNKEFAA